MEPSLQIASLLSPFIDVVKRGSDEIKNLLKEGLHDYLRNQTSKYYYTNNFLHRFDKVEFKSVYYPVTIGHKELTTRCESLIEFFEEYKFINVVGTAGSGKSTFVKYLFLESIKQSFKIPILIELRHLNDFNGDITEFIQEKILNQKVSPSKGILNRSFEQGSYFFLLDGFDEIFSKRKENVIKQLDEFIDMYPHNYFLISTRPGGGIENFPRFTNFHVMDFEESDIKEFIELQVDDSDRCDQIQKTIDGNLEFGFQEYLKNPLLLSMFILAYGNHPEIPKKKSAFYSNVFDTLFSKHDGLTKSGFPREKLTKLQKDEFEKILSVFSYLTLAEGSYSFTEELLVEKFITIKSKHFDLNFKPDDLVYDLRTSISILIKDGFEYHFPHRSLQEYFTALFIKRLPDSTKPKIYKRLSNIIKKNSNDHSFNLWELCEEMDYENFTKSFLIHELSNFLRVLNSAKNDEDLLKKFYDLWEPSLHYHTDYETMAPKLHIFRHHNFYGSLIDNYEVYDYRLLSHFIENNDLSDEVLNVMSVKLNQKIEPDDSTVETSELIHYHEVESILVKNGIYNVIKEYKKSIQTKIELLEMDLKKRNEDLKDLLDY